MHTTRHQGLASLLGFVALISFGGNAMANEFVKASEELCNKIRQCTFEQMGQEKDLPPEMRAMVENMMDNLCENMEKSYREAADKHNFEEPAAACVRSMAKLSCEDITASKETKECKTFEELASKTVAQ